MKRRLKYSVPNAYEKFLLNMAYKNNSSGKNTIRNDTKICKATHPQVVWKSNNSASGIHKNCCFRAGVQIVGKEEGSV